MIFDSIQAYKHELQRVKVQLINDRPARTLKIALNILALTKLRIQSSGKDFQGQAFKSYSNQYANTRKSRGLQISYVDFTDTGRMWANIKPQLSGNSQFESTVTVRARSVENQDKLDSQQKKRGNILRPSQSEIQEANRLNGKFVTQILKPIL